MRYDGRIRPIFHSIDVRADILNVSVAPRRLQLLCNAGIDHACKTRKAARDAVDHITLVVVMQHR